MISTKASFRFFLFLAAIAVLGCKKPYNPPVITQPNAYLVVEGVINSGGDTTTIKLSRTVNVGAKTAASPVLKATVTVESDQGTIFALKETGKGNYIAPALNINSSRQYQLHIKTTDNREYRSDLVPVQTTPPIDSVGFTTTNNGLVINASTHDPNNSVQYYRYDYTEEWEFHAYYFSQYIAVGNSYKDIQDSLLLRDATNQTYMCFTGDTSANIVLASSAGLKQAVIYQTPVATVQPSSEKIETEYSIQVKQYALTKGAYDFYTQLKSNTEDLGSIFDALPSAVTGNIHCVSNPAEPVIGYISVNNVASKRIFVRRQQLPHNWLAVYPAQCAMDTAYISVTASYNNHNGNEFEVFILWPPHLDQPLDHGVYGATFSTPICSDCTIRGKRNPPAYWVY